MATAGCVLGLLVIFYSLYKASEKVEEASNCIAYRLRMPASVAGATLLAVASSAPEFFTSASGAILHGVFEIGLMTIVWSAIFNILVIPGIAGLVAPKPLRISKEVVHRDGIGYMATVFILLLVVWDGNLTRADAVILLILYTLYIHTIRLMARAHQEAHPDDQREAPEDLWGWRKIILWFSAGIAVIGIGAHFMIELGKFLSETYAADLGFTKKESIVVMSAMVFAPGTSLADLFVSYFCAKRGEGSAAISNVFGSNVFDLTICLAVPVLIVGDVPIDLGPVWPSIIMLVLLQCMVLGFVRTSWQIERWEGLVMLVAFIICCVLFFYFMPETTGMPMDGIPSDTLGIPADSLAPG